MNERRHDSVNEKQVNNWICEGIRTKEISQIPSLYSHGNKSSMGLSDLPVMVTE